MASRHNSHPSLGKCTHPYGSEAIPHQESLQHFKKVTVLVQDNHSFRHRFTRRLMIIARGQYLHFVATTLNVKARLSPSWWMKTWPGCARVVRESQQCSVWKTVVGVLELVLQSQQCSQLKFEPFPQARNYNNFQVHTYQWGKRVRLDRRAQRVLTMLEARLLMIKMRPNSLR